MKKRFISYSEFWLFYNKGLEEYYKNYILGVREKPNEAMLFGTICHKLLEDKEFDYKKELKEKLFTDNFIRVADKINKEVPRAEKGEVSLFIDTDKGFSVYAGIDGVNKDCLIEYKTGKSYWTQDRADESEQITMYTLAYYLETGKLMPFKLITISSSNGNHRVLETKRTKEEIMHFLSVLEKFKDELIKLNYFETKCGFNDRIEI